MSDEGESFVEALNGLVEEYGLWVSWHPSGLRLVDEDGEDVGWILGGYPGDEAEFRFLEEL